MNQVGKTNVTMWKNRDAVNSHSKKKTTPSKLKSNQKMEESSKLKVQEQKIDIDNDKKVQESDAFPHDKNNDLYQVKVESKPNEHEYHLDEENEEVKL